MTQHQLGRYEIIEEIGSGGFAAVFRARDTVLDREVAVKVMRPLLMSDAGFVARFEREAQVAANLEHPHIIPVYDYGEENGRLYIVMKLVRQGSLERRLEQGPIPFAQTMTIASQIAAALDYAHEQQVIHRDIKPDNVLLGRNNHVYLADFGLVKALQQSSLSASLSSGILGTPAYIAPELWRDQPPTPQTDIYALACLLFEMLNGRTLFEASSPPATMHLHFQPPAFPEQWPPGVPAGIEQILQKALAQNPAERYPTAGAFVQDLIALAPAAASTDPPKPKVTPLPRWLMGIGAALVLTLGCLLLYFALIYGGGDDRQSQAEATTAPAVGLTTDEPSPTSQVPPTPTPTNTPTPLPAHTATPQAGDVVLVTLPNSNMATEMVYIPAGPFMMGSESDDAWNDEKPVHEAHTGAYWLDRTPVTNAQFAAFVADTNYATTAEIEGTGWVWSVAEDGSASWQQVADANWRQPHGPESDWAAADLSDHPVVQVSWDDAAAFCEWRTARLPTETEWEKAARGTDQRIYPWGDEFIGTNLNYCDRNCPFSWRDETVDDGHIFTSPVGSYPAGASPYAALDMAGNVWEWTDSWFMAYPGNTDEDTAYGETFKVLRGGSWLDDLRVVRSSNRLRISPVGRNGIVGFRCASSAP